MSKDVDLTSWGGASSQNEPSLNLPTCGGDRRSLVYRGGISSRSGEPTPSHPARANPVGNTCANIPVSLFFFGKKRVVTIPSTTTVPPLAYSHRSLLTTRAGFYEPTMDMLCPKHVRHFPQPTPGDLVDTPANPLTHAPPSKFPDSSLLPSSCWRVPH